MIDQTTHNHEILAIILSNRYSAQGIKFFTPDEFSQQLAYVNRPKGYEIEPACAYSGSPENRLDPDGRMRSFCSC
jgi:hypothetical protein